MKEVGLTTNGLRLEPLLPALRGAGLNRLNVSLDAPDAAGFRRVTRREGLERVLSALRAARWEGFTPLKINAVGLQDTDYAGLVRLAMREGLHVRFIELMEIGEARAFHPTAFVPAEEMRRRILAAGLRLEEAQELDEATSRVWRVAEFDENHCSVGFITTVTRPFCSTCDRLRLTSQGRLHTCLTDDVGRDLLGALRAEGDDAVRAFGARWRRSIRPSDSSAWATWPPSVADGT